MCLKPIVILAADILSTETTGILQLHTALLIEPVLQADGQIGLIPAIDLCITVEGLARGHDVEGTSHRDTSGDITTTGTDLAVLTAEPLCTDASRTSFLVLTW